MTQFYIVRHGNTFGPGETPTRIGARTDLPLTTTGQIQADKLGERFLTENVKFSSAFTSSLCRAIETGERILAYSSLPVELQTLESLIEIDHGPDENRPEEEVIRRIGAEAIHAWDEAGVPPQGWVVRVDERVAAWKQFFVQQASTRPDSNILLVTSNGAARFSLLASQEVGASMGSFETLKLRTGSYGQIKYLTNMAPRIVCWDVRP